MEILIYIPMFSATNICNVKHYKTIHKELQCIPKFYLMPVRPYNNQ